mmetsp:Transcript_6349/g.16381  ORF Transcript_6349/g.16381 Transcript_6349/m.16381 type:complete len:205 (-) Transcript_6349:75-689(-)
MSARTWIVAAFAACIALAFAGVAQAQTESWYNLLDRLPARPATYVTAEQPQMLAHSESDSSSHHLTEEEIAAMAAAAAAEAAAEAAAAEQARQMTLGLLNGAAGFMLDMPVPSTGGGSAAIGGGSCPGGDLLCLRLQSRVVSEPEFPEPEEPEEPEMVMFMAPQPSLNFGSASQRLANGRLATGGDRLSLINLSGSPSLSLNRG